VDTAKVVEREVERQRVDMVVELLAERIREAGEAAHGHAHGEVLALDLGRETCAASGLPSIRFFCVTMHSAGL
jgi:hypothetical protein